MAECARIMKALMNNKVGLEGLLNTPHSIRPLCGTLHHPDVQVVRLVHQLLLVVLIHGQDGYKCAHHLAPLASLPPTNHRPQTLGRCAAALRPTARSKALPSAH